MRRVPSFVSQTFQMAEKKMRKRFSDQTLWGKNKKIYDQTIGQPDLQRGRVNSVRIGFKIFDPSASSGQIVTQVSFFVS